MVDMSTVSYFTYSHGSENSSTRNGAANFSIMHHRTMSNQRTYRSGAHCVWFNMRHCNCA